MTEGMTVAEIMSPRPTVVRVDDSIERAAEEMALSGIRHLPVVDREGVLVGIVSQRDLVADHKARTRSIREIMEPDVKTVAPDTRAHEAAYLLLRHAIGCVPVTDSHGMVLGIVTDSDFVRVAYALLGGRVPVDEIEEEERGAEHV